LRAFWNFEVNELSTASGGTGQILRPPRAAKTVATPLSPQLCCVCWVLVRVRVPFRPISAFRRSGNYTNPKCTYCSKHYYQRFCYQFNEFIRVSKGQTEHSDSDIP